MTRVLLTPVGTALVALVLLLLYVPALTPPAGSAYSPPSPGSGS